MADAWSVQFPPITADGPAIYVIRNPRDRTYCAAIFNSDDELELFSPGWSNQRLCCEFVVHEAMARYRELYFAWARWFRGQD